MKKIILIAGIILIAIILVLLGQNRGIPLPAKNTGSNAPATSGKNVTVPASGNVPVSTGAKILDLSSKGLTGIPSYVFNMAGLEELNISHNSIRSIPSEIGKLKNLKILNASFNQMAGVPAEIGQLKNLGVLDLSYNNLTGLPQELGNLQNLKLFNLAGNNYSKQDFDSIRSKLPANTIIISK